MFYSDDPSLVFLAIPKTGTRTIYSILKNEFDGQLFKEHCITKPAHLLNRFTFCVVRNPYDRICSMWWSTCKRGDDKYGFIRNFKKHGYENNLVNFLKTIKKLGTGNQVVTLKQSDFFLHNHIDQILQFENLEDGFNSLQFVKKNVSLPMINPTTETCPWNTKIRPEWQSIVNHESINLINEIYSEDFLISDYRRIAT